MNCRIENGPGENEIVSKELFRGLERCVAGKRNVVIMGVQGSGKTELLNGFFRMDYKKTMAQEQKRLIYQVNLSNKETVNDILGYLAEQLRASLSLLLKNDADSTELDELLAQLKELGDLGALSAEIRLNQIIEVLHANGYFIIFVMDGFERFTSSTNITMSHHDILRSLIAAGKVQCVVATDYDLSMDSLPKSVAGSSFLQQFTKKTTVLPFSQQEASECRARNQKA